MANCKDCLHCDVCYMVEHYGVDIEEDRQEYDCHQFKAKKNYVKVVHGRWEQGDYYDCGDVCSVCDWDSYIDNCDWSYCPNCGAKMDGKENQ